MKKNKVQDDQEIGKMHRFSVDVDDATWEAMKIRAIKERKTVKEILAELIKEYLRKG
jgi:hypothetical protein